MDETNKSTLVLEELVSEMDAEIDPADDILSKQAMEDQESAEVFRHFDKQYIRFLLNDILLALPLSSALEIGYRPAITSLPNLPDWLLGVSNIRGEIISMVDLKIYFGLLSQGFNRGSRFIITKNNDLKLGLIVDRIMGIIPLDKVNAEVQENPYREGEIASFVNSVVTAGDDLLNILDIDKLLSSQRLEGFKAE